MFARAASGLASRDILELYVQIFGPFSIRLNNLRLLPVYRERLGRIRWTGTKKKKIVKN